jgi:hypothetical protein
MRINNAYILNQPKISATGGEMSSANRAEKQQRIQQAKDSYSKNAASAQIIDAEYVELYSPENKIFQQENQKLHQTLEPGASSTQQEYAPVKKDNSSFSRYQMTPVDTPLPGTYLNIFA